MNADRRHAATGLAFVSPALVFTALLFVLPLGLTVWMSLHDWPLLGEPTFIGLDNYGRVLTDGTFRDSLLFTAKYTVLVTIAIFAVAFGLALLVNRARPGVGLFRTAFFLPTVVGLGAASLLWSWLYNPRFGYLPDLVVRLGLADSPPQWMLSSTGALICVIVMVVWKTAGFNMLLLLVGMQSIPREEYEAARIDGAGPTQQFFFITLPRMKATITLALALSLTGSYLAFEQFFIITRGNPAGSTLTAVFASYKAAFTQFKLGLAAAVGVVLLIVIGLLNLVQIRLMRRETDQ
ncbi:MAG: sugar ABC transporter permease [Nonomuraea sp.]|nr:sugar ABC transporter permease [Streptomyces sp.]NUP84050.1 sugar ABC transporter permease [Nonomuraea sp.]